MRRTTRRPVIHRLFWVALIFSISTFVYACGGGGGGDGEAESEGSGSITSGDYVVLAWNDLGMHCLNPTYDQLVILPLYNTLWAQVIQRGDPPRVVTDNVEVQYAILNYTTSACNGCHTALPSNISASQFPHQFPHQFTWQAR